MLMGLVAIAALCFAACGGGGDEIIAPIGDAADAGDVPAAVVIEPTPAIAVEEPAPSSTATPFSMRMGSIPTAAVVPTSAPDSVGSTDATSTPVSVSTETPADTAVSTPAPVVAVDTPAPAPTAVATEEPAPIVAVTVAPVAEATQVSSDGSITPSQIGAIDWRPYADEGYVFYTEDEGRLLQGVVIDGSLVECGPAIGTSFDPDVNPTARDDSHYIWVWAEDLSWAVDPNAKDCLAVSKYFDWANEVDWENGTLPNLRETASIEDVADDDPRRASGGDDLVFFYQVNDRSYTMPPVLDVHEAWWGSACSEGYEDLCFSPESGLIDLYTEVEVPELGYSSVCGDKSQPLAVWTEMRGFVALSDEDSFRALFRVDFDEMDSYREIYSADWAAGREAGVYQVWPTPFESTPPGGDDHQRLSQDGYCWIVKNRDEVPIEPCLTCEDPGGSLRYTSWQR